MSGAYRLRLRWTVDEAVIAGAVCGARRWRSAPASWSWSWPLDASGASQNARPPRGAADGPDLSLTGSPAPAEDGKSRDGAAPDVSWLRNVRSVAVSDDGNSVAFVSKKGKAFLATRSGEPQVRSVTVDSTFMKSSSAGAGASNSEPTTSGENGDLLAFASSVACFRIQHPDTLQAVDVLAVGYDSGAIVLFDVSTCAPYSVSRPVPGQPVRRLRFVSMFHLLDPVGSSSEHATYPFLSSNSGLFCVFGWSGVLGRLSTPLIWETINSKRNDIRGANWTLWRVNEQDIVVDATPCSSEPSSICEMDSLPNQGALRIVAGGHNPPIAAFACGDVPAFSARDAARMAAAAVWRVAGSALYSRLMPGTKALSGQKPDSEDKDAGKATNASVRTSLTWTDSFDQVQASSFGFQNVKESARQSLSAVVRRRRASALAAGGHLRRSIEGEEGYAGSERYSLVSHLGTIGPGSRVIQQCVSAPLPCSLFATCDSLGRVLIVDARDLCVLHVLKGFRDARVAWLASDGPALVAMAPRRSLLEVHDPILAKRHAGFRIETGSLLIQSAAFGIFYFTPQGCMYELISSKEVIPNENSIDKADDESSDVNSSRMEVAKVEDAFDTNSEVFLAIESPAAEIITGFITLCKTGQVSSAFEIMDTVAVTGVQGIAHLMAALVCTSTFVRSQVHVAVAAEAARLAKEAENADLELRFEAHGRLGEAFGLLVAAMPPRIPSQTEMVASKDLGRLRDDENICSLLHSFSDETFGSKMTKEDPVASAKPDQSSAGYSDTKETNVDGGEFCCEDFILAHVILPPDSEACLLQGYALRPRDDLSALERVWLSRAYFNRLLAIEENDLTRGSNPEPSSCLDVFRALRHVLGYEFERIVSHFIDFFLWSPMEVLLDTPVAQRHSGLRCALNRFRGGSRRAAVDDMIIEYCENSTRICNALLLVRLCVVQEDNVNSAGVDERYLVLVEKLTQAVALRTYLVGSRTESAVRGRITASHFQGDPGEAERQAVTLLGDSGESSKAAAVLAGMSYQQPQPEWHVKASVSEVALQITRRRISRLLDPAAHKELPPKLSKWIEESLTDNPGNEVEEESHRSDLSDLQLIKDMKGMQVLLNAAHEHFPDTSIDAARCSQLQEGITFVLRRFEGSGKCEAESSADGNRPVVSLNSEGLLHED